MISILEVAERAHTGTRLEDREWGMGLFRKLQQLIARHRLTRKAPDKFYEVDNDYADSLFQAAVDLLVETGVFSTQTHRVIIFTEDEVRQALRETPSEVTMGRGPERRTWYKRDFEDSRPAGISVAGHGPWSDKMIPLPIVVRELVRHRRVDMIEGFMYANIDGHEVNGPALRAYAARRALDRVRDGLTMAGRGGLAITNYPVLTDAFSLVAPLDAERGLRRGDGGFFTILPDLMVEEDLIAAAIVYQEMGCYCLSGGRGNGPWGGGPDGEIVESTAGAIAQWMIYGDTLLDATGGFSASNYSGRKAEAAAPTSKPTRDSGGGLNWQSFAQRKALNRNTNHIFYIGPWGGNRIYYDMTSEQYLLKVALSSIESTITGLNMRVGATNPPTHTSWIVETSDAAIKSGTSLEDFAELYERVNREKLSDYTEQSTQDQRMHIYGDDPMKFLAAGLKAYDWYKQAPTDDYLKIERKARNYLRDIGLKI